MNYRRTKRDKKLTRVAIYIRNRTVGSSYYRKYQYGHRCAQGEISCVFREYTSVFEQRLLRKGDASRWIRYTIGPVIAIHGMLRRIGQLITDIRHPPDTILVQREVFRRFIPPFGWMLLKKIVAKTTVIWDFDDHIFSYGEITVKEKALYERYAARIIVPHAYLQSLLSSDCRNRVIFLPTTDYDIAAFDCARLLRSRKQTYRDTFRILWLGTYGNLTEVKAIERALDESAKAIREKTGKTVILEIVCNQHMQLDMPNVRVENTVWLRDRALLALQRAHVGIMPLCDNAFTRGKAGFKAVQYIGAGIPVILSKVGFNAKVIQEGKSGFFANDSEKWTEGLMKLATDEGLYTTMSILARKRWENEFNAESVSKEYMTLFSHSPDMGAPS